MQIARDQNRSFQAVSAIRWLHTGLKQWLIEQALAKANSKQGGVQLELMTALYTPESDFEGEWFKNLCHRFLDWLCHSGVCGQF